MRSWRPERVAGTAGARMLRAPAGAQGPAQAVIDSRAAGPGDLFVGIPGRRVDGGSFAPAVLGAGAWGVLTTPARAEEALPAAAAGCVLAAEDPVRALGRLARGWRRSLGAGVVGVTGSTGKTSTKDTLAAMLAPHRATVATRANLNTEIGVPLGILAAPAGTEALVLELAMRGTGQIAELAEIAEPDVAVIVNIGPVHLEQVGSLEGVAAAKAELIAGLRPGATAVIPAGEPLLRPHLRDDVETVTFGPGGDVSLVEARGGRVTVDAGGERIELELPYEQPYLLLNALACVAAALALGVTPGGRVDVALSALRGERIELPNGSTIVNDCYNANPMSVRAALDDLARRAPGRRVAVLGDMLELGQDEARFHEEVGEHAGRAGIEVLVAVGPRAAAMAGPFGGESHAVEDAREAAEVLGGLLRTGDTVLVKGSRGVGLEVVAEALAAGPPR